MSRQPTAFKRCILFCLKYKFCSILTTVLWKLMVQVFNSGFSFHGEQFFGFGFRSRRSCEIMVRVVFHEISSSSGSRSISMFKVRPQSPFSLNCSIVLIALQFWISIYDTGRDVVRRLRDGGLWSSLLYFALDLKQPFVMEKKLSAISKVQ